MIRVVLVDGERHEFPTPAWRTSYAGGFLDVYRPEGLGELSTIVETWKVPIARVHWVQEVVPAVTPAFVPFASEASTAPFNTFVECDCSIADACPQGRVGMERRCRIVKRTTESVPEGTDR